MTMIWVVNVYSVNVLVGVIQTLSLVCRRRHPQQEEPCCRRRSRLMLFQQCQNTCNGGATACMDHISSSLSTLLPVALPLEMWEVGNLVT
jgi:hypothetical protein